MAKVLYRLRLKPNCGDHVLRNGKTIKAGQVFKTSEPLHEKFQNKFKVITSVANDEEVDEDPPETKLVDKTEFFPLAEEKGVRVFRNRETKLYCVKDGDTVVQDGLEKAEVEEALEGAENHDLGEEEDVDEVNEDEEVEDEADEEEVEEDVEEDAAVVEKKKTKTAKAEKKEARVEKKSKKSKKK